VSAEFTEPTKDYPEIFDYGVECRRGKTGSRCEVPLEVEEKPHLSWGNTARVADLLEERLSDMALYEGYVARARLQDDFK
jgi:hypothetical protein